MVGREYKFSFTQFVFCLWNLGHKSCMGEFGRIWKRFWRLVIERNEKVSCSYFIPTFKTESSHEVFLFIAFTANNYVSKMSMINLKNWCPLQGEFWHIPWKMKSSDSMACLCLPHPLYVSVNLFLGLFFCLLWQNGALGSLGWKIPTQMQHSWGLDIWQEWHVAKRWFGECYPCRCLGKFISIIYGLSCILHKSPLIVHTSRCLYV